MTSEPFWTSQDGQILALRNKNGPALSLTLAFRPRHPAEAEFLRERRRELHFTERSTLARIGIEMITRGEPVWENGRVLLEADAFIFDPNFPTAPFFKKLLRPGTPVGRLFHSPESAKLSADQVWQAVKENRLKLPDTISIDRFGRVFLTPHKVRYTLHPKLGRSEFERLVNGDAGRSYIDKVQIREESEVLAIPPRSGILTSCSMYLKEHYVVLNRGEGNFGLHCSAVLLDPIKTTGTNIMLEIYNTGDQPVVNPVVSVEIFRAPAESEAEARALRQRRRRLLQLSAHLYQCLDERPARDIPSVRPKTRITVQGQNALMENRSLFLNASQAAAVLRATRAGKDAASCGHRTVLQALDHAPEDADTLLIDYFPNLLEHIELLTRIGERIRLRRIIFRKPSRTHGFFLSNNAHSRLEVYRSTQIDVYWYHEDMGDLYQHVYKKERGFFLREELVPRFLRSTILAMYGSALTLDTAQTEKIAALIGGLTDFFGRDVGILTGGGGGVMRLAFDQARRKNCLTGACFLELEAQPPELGVDFFNTFQETARHNRQKWFELADFVLFNVGGVGTLEEIGIELCNLKLGIRPRIPYVFFADTYWRDLRRQVREMIRAGRAPRWMLDYILFTADPDEVIAFYRKTLRVM